MNPTPKKLASLGISAHNSGARLDLSGLRSRVCGRMLWPRLRRRSAAARRSGSVQRAALSCGGVARRLRAACSLVCAAWRAVQRAAFMNVPRSHFSAQGTNNSYELRRTATTPHGAEKTQTKPNKPTRRADPSSSVGWLGRLIGRAAGERGNSAGTAATSQQNAARTCARAFFEPPAEPLRPRPAHSQRSLCLVLPRRGIWLPGLACGPPRKAPREPERTLPTAFRHSDRPRRGPAALQNYDPAAREEPRANGQARAPRSAAYCFGGRGDASQRRRN